MFGAPTHLFSLSTSTTSLHGEVLEVMGSLGRDSSDSVFDMLRLQLVVGGPTVVLLGYVKTCHRTNGFHNGPFTRRTRYPLVSLPGEFTWSFFVEIVTY